MNRAARGFPRGSDLKNEDDPSEVEVGEPVVVRAWDGRDLVAHRTLAGE